MDLGKAALVNEAIICKTVDKLGKRLEKDGWDNEEFNVMSQALDNLMDITKIEATNKKEEIKALRERRRDAQEEETEFETLMYKLVLEKKDVKTILAATAILSDHMTEIRALHPKVYQKILYKLNKLI